MLSPPAVALPGDDRVRGGCNGAEGKGAMVWVLHSQLKVIRQRPVFWLYNTTTGDVNACDLFPFWTCTSRVPHVMNL